MQDHTDIALGGWTARLPTRWKTYFLLARLDRPIGAWLLFLPGLWSILLARAPVGETARLTVLFGVGAVLMRAAGCVVNDFWDRNLDRLVTRTAGRPLASGTVGLRAAGLFLVMLMLAALAVLLQLNRLAQLLGWVSLPLVALYPLAKRITWWPQIVLGFTFGWGVPMGYAATAARLDGAAGMLYLASIFWILGYDTIYAHQDREDDALIGIKSTARLFGDESVPFIAGCYLLMLVSLGTAAWLAGLSRWFFAGLLAPAVLLGSQVARLNIHDPRCCLQLFKANRDVGLAVALAILLGRL